MDQDMLKAIVAFFVLGTIHNISQFNVVVLSLTIGANFILLFVIFLQIIKIRNFFAIPVGFALVPGICFLLVVITGRDSNVSAIASAIMMIAIGLMVVLSYFFLLNEND